MKKLSIFASIALITNFGLVGCGGGSSVTDAGSAANTSDASTILVRGTAIDPELVGATVCLDINGDENCTTVDPSTVTDENGDYTLQLTQEQIEGSYPLLVIGGVDKATGEAFKGKLLADINSSMQNITPLTTLTYEQFQKVSGHSGSEADKEKIEEILGVSFEEMQENIVTMANEGKTKALQVALTLQKSAEALMPEDPLQFYADLAEKMKSADPSKTLEELILELTPDTIKTEMLTFLEETMTTSLDGAYAMAEQAKDEAVARGLDFASRMIDMQHEDGMQNMPDNNGSNDMDTGAPMNPSEGMPSMPGMNDSNTSSGEAIETPMHPADGNSTVQPGNPMNPGEDQGEGMQPTVPETPATPANPMGF